MLVYSAADFEDSEARPEMPNMEADLAGDPAAGRELLALAATRHLRPDHRPGACRAEKVNRDTPTACTGSSTTPRRSARATSTASQPWRRHRGAAPHGLSGEYFVERYNALRAMPPIRKMLAVACRWAAPTPPGWPATIPGPARLAGHRQDRGGLRLYPREPAGS